MKSTLLRFGLIPLILVVIGLLSACETPNTKFANTSGFGGTGSPSVALQDPTSGFGGTGRTSSGFGGTGIIGTITEFGSIWVNGIEIGYGEKTQISSTLRQNDQLKLGQQVVLETLPLEDKTLSAKIQIYYPIAGQITKINGDKLTIDQHDVLLNNNTFKDAGLKLEIGQYIAMNGYQNANHSWTATRLNLNPEFKQFYHPSPDIAFSENVQRLIIETTMTQFNHWHQLESLKQFQMHESPSNTQPSQRLIIEAKRISGEFRSERIEPYPAFLQMQQRQHEQFENINTQKNMLEIQRRQRDLIQEQLEQQRQQQETREQQQIMQNQFGPGRLQPRLN